MSAPELLETWFASEYEIYGSWAIGPSRRQIGAAVGVPGWQQETARKARTTRGLCDAWFEDASDWQNAPGGWTLDEAQEALGELSKHAASLLREYADDAREEVR